MIKGIYIKIKKSRLMWNPILNGFSINQFHHKVSSKIPTKLIYAPGGRFPWARLQSPRANRMLVTKALPHDVAHLAFVPYKSSCGAFSSCCSHWSRRLALQSRIPTLIKYTAKYLIGSLLLMKRGVLKFTQLITIYEFFQFRQQQIVHLFQQ